MRLVKVWQGSQSHEVGLGHMSSHEVIWRSPRDHERSYKQCFGSGFFCQFIRLRKDLGFLVNPFGSQWIQVFSPIRIRVLKVCIRIRPFINLCDLNYGFWRSLTKKDSVESSVVDPDPYWICIQELPGSGSVFGIQIRIHTCKYRIKWRQKM